MLLYQAIRAFDNTRIPFGTPDAFLFEHFLPWLYKIMIAYQNQQDIQDDELIPQGNKFSKGYYTKKVN